MKTYHIVIAVLIMFSITVLALPAYSEPKALEPVEVATRLQEQYDKTRSMTADFEQKSTMRMSDRVREAKGTVVIVKPGKIRWDYIDPDRQVLVGDGKKFYMYFEKTKQMVIRALEEYVESDVTYSFFAGSGNILRDFDVQSLDQGDKAPAPVLPDSDNRYGLKLTPKKPHSQVELLYVWVDADNFLVSRLQILDLFGNTTDLSFAGIKANPEVPEKSFNFVPPADTEIIEQF